MKGIFTESKVHPDLLKIFKTAFLNAVKGNTDQFMYNIDVYLRNAPTALAYYTTKGTTAILGVKGKNAVKDISKINQMYCAIFGVLQETVCVGIDMTKEGYPSALYTRSAEWLKYLKDSGKITGVTDDYYNKVITALQDNKTALGFEEGSYMVVRLDVDTNIRGSLTFKPVMPRSRFKIGVGKDFVFIPVVLMHEAATFFKQMKTNAFQFVKTSVTGQRKHIATCKPEVLKAVYKNAPENLVRGKIDKAPLGYNEATLRFECYDLEASMYAIGSASFRPEMLDRIAPAKLSDVDTSFHKVNVTHLRGIFKTRVKKMKLADYDTFKLFDTSSFPTVDKKAEALITWSEDIDGRDLLTIMQTYPSIFGDIKKSLATRERNSPHILKDLQMVQAPYTVGQVYDLLNTGVVKITARSKTNKIYERLASNNEDVLKRFLGKDYVVKLESTSKRIDGAMKELDSFTTDPSREELENLLVKYDLLAVINSQDFIKTSPKKALLDALNNSTKKNVDPKTIIYRKLESKERNEFYGQVNIDNIISIEYAKF
jgi:hypothetical protein